MTRKFGLNENLFGFNKVCLTNTFVRAYLVIMIIDLEDKSNIMNKSGGALSQN